MTQESDPERKNAGHAPVLQVRGERVVIGDWSGDLGELIARNVELRGMLRQARYADAQALVQAQSVEEQAALVAMDENPEEVLSLTGMDAQGRPGYRPEVVARLPADIVAEVLVPRNARLVRFNTEILRQMSPEAFERVVDETLDPVYFPANRTQVAWEWLEAVAALGDSNKIAELLFKVDPSALEEALLDKVGDFGMHDEVFAGNFGTISAFRVISESGHGVMLPPIEDPEVAEVIHILHQAAPELMARVIRRAWERR